MSVDKNSIKSAVTGIEFTEESKQRIFDGIERRKNLKQKIHIKRITTGIVATAIVFLCVFTNILQKNKSIIIQLFFQIINFYNFFKKKPEHVY